MAMEHVGSLQGHRCEVLCVHSPGDARLASGAEDGSVRIWDVQAGRAARAIVIPAADAAGAVNAVCLGGGGGGGSAGTSSAEASNWLFAAAGTNVYGFDLRAPGVLLREPAKRFANLASDEIGHIVLHEAANVLV